MAIPNLTLNYSALVREIIANRGRNLHEFMNPQFSSFPNIVFENLKETKEAIIKAIQSDTHITIWGDFDADGQTSTALLMDVFRMINYTNVSYHIPSRFNSNHGLNRASLKVISETDPKSLVITCDNGTNDIEEVEYGNSLGLQFIITDHHEQTGPLPAALYIMNPSLHLLDSPYRGLCGVGVAYILGRSLLISYGMSEYTKELLDLVAIGTIADVAPHTSLNRTLLSHGLPILWSGQRMGLYYMYKYSDIKSFVYGTEEVSFKIGPMLNAAGRIATADFGVELLMANDEQTAKYYALKLKLLNQDRQIQMAIMEHELEALLPENTRDVDGLVLVGENLHPGLIGLTAGKLARRFKKPSIVVTSMDDNFLRGSCRTSEGVHILSVLETQRDILEQYGGHAGAAGFIIKRTNIDDLISGFLSSINQFKKFDSSHAFYDYELPWEDVDISFRSTSTLSQIESMAPFHEGNPEPLLLSKGVYIDEYKIIGDQKTHAVLTLRKGNNIQEAYWWRFDPNIMSLIDQFDSREIDIIYSIQRSFFIRMNVRIVIEYVRIHETGQS